MSGRVVILNGSSSAGKTSIATLFRDQQAELGHLWLVTGIDDYQARIPPQWFRIADWVGEYSDEGVWFEATDNGLRVRAGADARQIYRAYHRSVAAWAHEGLDVVVDDVAIDKVQVDDWHVALNGLEVVWVAVRCDVDVVVAREAERGDRQIGLAQFQSATVHEHLTYDLELDTTSTSTEDLLAQLTGFLRDHP